MIRLFQPDLIKRGAEVQILKIIELEELQGSIHLPISLTALSAESKPAKNEFDICVPSPYFRIYSYL